MEINEQDFLNELLALRRDTWETIQTTEMNEFLTNGDWSFDCYNENPSGVSQNSLFFEGFSDPNSVDHDNNNNNNFNNNNNNNNNSAFEEYQHPFFFGDELSTMHHQYNNITDSMTTDSSCTNMLDTPPFPTQEDYPFSMIMEDEEVGVLGGNNNLNNDSNMMEMQSTCKVELTQSHEGPAFNMGGCMERKNRASKKVQGQPSKNLMAERRRRKRLNDRLSMLRSIVPKISKMDRTSILGDTIDYMKELLQRIQSLEENIEEGSNPNQLNFMDLFKDLKPNEIMIRNSPKFDVERRNMDSRIEICCAGKPGLLLSTINSLEALGLEIEQCVISCFNDFAMQASCSEDLEQRTMISSEDIKQTLFRNAGYGGRCL